MERMGLISSAFVKNFTLLHFLFVLQPTILPVVLMDLLVWNHTAVLGFGMMMMMIRMKLTSQLVILRNKQKSVVENGIETNVVWLHIKHRHYGHQYYSHHRLVVVLVMLVARFTLMMTMMMILIHTMNEKNRHFNI